MFTVIEGSGSGSGDKTQEAKGPVMRGAATASQMPAPARELVKPESDINKDKERLQIPVCYINL